MYIIVHGSISMKEMMTYDDHLGNSTDLVETSENWILTTWEII